MFLGMKDNFKQGLRQDSEAGIIYKDATFVTPTLDLSLEPNLWSQALNLAIGPDQAPELNHWVHPT